jgi:hypothetical protein
MANGDDLSEIIALARRQMPDIPDEAWGRLERIIRGDYGATRIYIAAHRKRKHLEAMVSAAGEEDSARLSDMLGVSVRRVQQLKKLR